MSNSAAAAVLTTTDLSEAIRAVRTLLGTADIDQGEVDFEAVIRSPDVLAQVRHVQDEPSQDHTVHVHARDRNGDQIARVHWLADQVGGRFTGRVESAPLQPLSKQARPVSLSAPAA